MAANRGILSLGSSWKLSRSFGDVSSFNKTLIRCASSNLPSDRVTHTGQVLKHFINLVKNNKKSESSPYLTLFRLHVLFMLSLYLGCRNGKKMTTEWPALLGKVS